MNYQPTIGLEIHIELNTQTKMFCACKNNPDEKRPNFNICPVCLGHPGTLPVINEEAIKKVIKTGLALNCQIPRYSRFDRKNYFYPDLPKGYQISQYDMPLSKNGYLEISAFDEKFEDKNFQSFDLAQDKFSISNFQTNSKPVPSEVEGFQITNYKRIGIREVHLEEDTGKLIHPEGTDYSLVDFNRAGAPLMELVTEPDISSAAEAKKFCQELQLILRYLEVSDADMEKGQMRCEVNISLNQKSKIKNQKLGTKVEIKNLNSFKAVEKSIEYEVRRQSEILDRGQKIIQETRGWDPQGEITISQRTKEEAHDYRYFPEPDLPPLESSQLAIYSSQVIAELPQAKRKRFAEEYKLLSKDIAIIISNKNQADYFEDVASEFKSWSQAEEIEEKEIPKVFRLLANYFTRDLQKLLGQTNTKIADIKITPENFAEFIVMVYEGRISSTAARQIFSEMFTSGGDPEHIIQDKGLLQISDEGILEPVILEVIKNNPQVVEDYKKGKSQALQFLIGKVMAETRGKANPKIVMEVLKKNLENK